MRFNPLKGGCVSCLHIASQVEPTFLISDIRALWGTLTWMAPNTSKCNRLTPLRFKGLIAYRGVNVVRVGVVTLFGCRFITAAHWHWLWHSGASPVDLKPVLIAVTSTAAQLQRHTAHVSTRLSHRSCTARQLHHRLLRCDAQFLR